MSRVILIVAVLVLLALLVPRHARAAQWPQQTYQYGGPAVVVPVPRPRAQVWEPTTRSYSVFDSEKGLRWGTVDVQPDGSFTQWDSNDGYRWGRVEVD